jgi:hypothetical protein
MKFIKNNYSFVVEYNNQDVDDYDKQYDYHNYDGTVMITATHINSRLKWSGVLKINNTTLNDNIKNGFHSSYVKYIWPELKNLEKEKLSVRFLFDNDKTEYWINCDFDVSSLNYFENLQKNNIDQTNILINKIRKYKNKKNNILINHNSLTFVLCLVLTVLVVFIFLPCISHFDNRISNLEKLMVNFKNINGKIDNLENLIISNKNNNLDESLFNKKIIELNDLVNNKINDLILNSNITNILVNQTEVIKMDIMNNLHLCGYRVAFLVLFCYILYFVMNIK